MKKDLFEELRDKIHCEYVSDLRYIDYDLIRLHLKYLDYNEFELSEWLDAVNWFGNVTLETESPKEAYDFLINLNK